LSRLNFPYQNITCEMGFRIVNIHNVTYYIPNYILKNEMDGTHSTAKGDQRSRKILAEITN
jgi:hypothetical protein